MKAPILTLLENKQISLTQVEVRTQIVVFFMKLLNKTLRRKPVETIVTSSKAFSLNLF